MANTTRLLPWLVLLSAACSREEPASPAPSPARTAGPTGAAPADVAGRRGFDRMTPGVLPEGWRVAGTHQNGALATWSVVADPGASSPPNVLALTAATHGSGTTFNLCWDTASRFQDGTFELALRADGGEEDQGGGPIWRAKDEDNYYVCRANPLESNFRLYVVKDGERTQLASAEAKLVAGSWHTIRVEQAGPRIVCTLDGSVRLEAEDASLPEAGCVGLWTKADARTSFDDLVVRQDAPGAAPKKPRKAR
jgi:hypothetical protein